MPKIVDHDERRNHIAEAATQVILREGFDHATMREVAAAAGYTHGAIARYFPDKHSLLVAAFLRVHAQSHEQILASVMDTRGLTALCYMCREILPFGHKNAHASLVVAFWGHACEDEEVRALHRRNNMMWRDMFYRFLLEAREDGELAPHIDIDTAVNLIASHNAGWQMIGSLLSDLADDLHLEASLTALIDQFRAKKDTRDSRAHEIVDHEPGTLLTN